MSISDRLRGVSSTAELFLIIATGFHVVHLLIDMKLSYLSEHQRNWVGTLAILCNLGWGSGLINTLVFLILWFQL